MKQHDHDWKKVPPIVVTVNDPLAETKGRETYNARCFDLRSAGVASLA